MRFLRLAATATAVLLSTALAACSGSEQTPTTGGDITIQHAYGETVIDGTPQRIATVAWANHEVPLALGVMPVGMSKATWGDDDNDGMLPWVAEAVEKLGGEPPVLFDETDALPYEEIAATEPDVILASYSGLSQEEYDQLSKIAPTVAFPKQAWTTSMDEMISMSAKAMGKEAEGKQLINDLNEQISKEFAAHPGLKDKSFLFTSFSSGGDLSKVGFYTTEDPRAGFLKQVGLEVPQVVSEKSDEAENFWVEVSAENTELFDDVDFFITYGSDDDAENEKQLKEMQKDPLFGRIPAIAEGRVAFIGQGPLGASANPSPLSIPWGLGDYFAVLETAAMK